MHSPPSDGSYSKQQAASVSIHVETLVRSLVQRHGGQAAESCLVTSEQPSAGLHNSRAISYQSLHCRLTAASRLSPCTMVVIIVLSVGKLACLSSILRDSRPTLADSSSGLVQEVFNISPEGRTK
jgi:hypothetical protein